MDPDRIIAEVAKRNSVLLPREDPIMQINTMLEMHAADHQEREAKLAQRDADLLAGLSRVLDRAEKQATGQLAATSADKLPAAIQALTVQTFWRTSLIAAGAGLGLLLAGAGGGYWWGSRTEAERYAILPAEYNVAMKNRNAGQWLELMRKNQANGALDGCAEVKQPAGGKACAFVLWTELPPAAAR